jgi:predicted Holliday junction resolvase-like endonuclease
MKYLRCLVFIPILAFGISSCGDKKDSAERNMEAQKAIQEGMQKEKQMYEGMQKGTESIEKKIQEQKEETKK